MDTPSRREGSRGGNASPATARQDLAPVETGIAGDRYFEVLSGLEKGEMVVSGDFKAIRDLEDGDQVKIEDSKPEKKK